MADWQQGRPWARQRRLGKQSSTRRGRHTVAGEGGRSYACSHVSDGPVRWPKEYECRGEPWSAVTRRIWGVGGREIHGRWPATREDVERRTRWPASWVCPAAVVGGGSKEEPRGRCPPCERSSARRCGWRSSRGVSEPPVEGRRRCELHGRCSASGARVGGWEGEPPREGRRTSRGRQGVSR